MVKILSKSGSSLADMYDVVGSIAGIEQLVSREVSLVHEMGRTLFSERLAGSMRRMTTGAILQSTNWDVVITNMPSFIFRVLAVVVLISPAGRVERAQLSMRTSSQGREVPFFIWDSTNDVETLLRIVDDDAAAGNTSALVPRFIQLPVIGIGNSQPRQVNEITFRGRTSAFGAGTVTLNAVIYQAFTHVGTVPSSYGLPVPSW